MKDWSLCVITACHVLPPYNSKEKTLELDYTAPTVPDLMKTKNPDLALRFYISYRCKIIV